MRIISLVLACLALAIPARAQDDIYFPATDNVAAKLVQKINAETVRIDMSVSLLTDHSIATALVNRFKAGIPVRLIGDRYSIFDVNDPSRRTEFYWLASQGVPIRVRQNPTSYPELAHWKATIFVGQNVVSFGSANYTPLELTPQSGGAFSDQTVMFTSDPALVNAFKAEFDRMWNDTDRELASIVGRPPYFLNWNDICAVEPECADYRTKYPSPQPMVISTARLEPAAAAPAGLLWAQGAAFNNRLVEAINAESESIDLVVHRLTVESITSALLAKHAAGVRVRVIIEPTEYRNTEFPEFWLTAANIDRLHAAGIPVKQRAHAGLTGMKMLVTSSVATNASSNFSSAWQRDHNYFVEATTKPAIYAAMRDRFSAMWTSATAFVNFTPLKPDAPQLQGPADDATGVSTNAALMWARTPFATSYDIYFGTSEATLAKVTTVDAKLVNDPPKTYWWRPTLQPQTTYYWRVVARTKASLSQPSPTRSFTTGAAAALTASPSVIDLSAAGGTGQIDVTATAGTAWTATSDAAWVTLSPASGSGNGAITYRAAYNDTSLARSATVSINGVWIAISQATDVAPSAPLALTAALSPPNVQFTWQPAGSGGRALRYQIDIADNAQFANARFFQTDVGAAPTMRVSTLSPGVYYARVSALNGMGISTPSAPISFTMTAPPSGGGGGGGSSSGGGGGAVGGGGDNGGSGPVASPFAPRSVTAQVVGSRVAISWNAPLQGTPVSYQVEAGLAPGQTDYILPTGTRSIAVNNVPIGIYYVRVRTITPSGPGDASLEMPVGVGIAVGPAPGAPVNLTAAVSGASVTLRWTPATHGDAAPTHYVLEAGMSPGTSNAAIMPVGAQTVIGVNAVPPGVYYVRVRAANGASLSAPSNEVRVEVR